MYQRDLAYIQHHGFSNFAKTAAPGLLRILRTAGITSGHVVDLGCGDGTWLRALPRRGFMATGIDQSAELLAYARAAAPRAVFRKISAHRCVFPPCDAMTALGEVLSYEPATPASLRRVFRRAHAALRPGGVFVFDVLVSGPPMSYLTWRSGQSWAVMVRVDERKNRVIRDIITFRKVQGGYRRSQERHRLLVVEPRFVLRELRRIGFVVRTAHGYGRVAAGHRRLVFIARKKRRERQEGRKGQEGQER
jgi:SAM-dependent methyltransferase